MIDKLFRSGNYNNWDRFINKTLPMHEEIFRSKVIASIDSILLKMLGNNTVIEKSSLNVSQICDRRSLKGVKYEIVYNINDFKVPEAPVSAVTKDTEALKNAFNFEGFELSELFIDIQTGNLKVSFVSMFKEN